MRKYRTYTEEQIIDAVKTSLSIREVLGKLNLKEAGGNYSTTKKYIKELNLDTSHFTGQGWNKGKTIGPKRPLEDYLSNQFPIGSYKLKHRLLKAGIFEHRCSNCQLTEWLGKPIPLELDHIDGNHENNNLLNVRFLCPNCHTLTPTYRGKKLKKIKTPSAAKTPSARIKVNAQPNPKNKCIICNTDVYRKSTYCSKCFPKNRTQSFKIEWPSVEILKQMIAESSCLSVAKQLGVSDNAVRKHIKTTK